MSTELIEKLAKEHDDFVKLAEKHGLLSAITSHTGSATRAVNRLKAYAKAYAEATQEQDGWQLVPIEPTEEMKSCAWEAYRDSNKPAPYNAMVDAYKAMLASAPKKGE